MNHFYDTNPWSLNLVLKLFPILVHTHVSQHNNTFKIIYLQGVFESVKGVQKEVLDTKLDAWKREQQLAGNGLQITQSLENIQVNSFT